MQVLRLRSLWMENGVQAYPHEFSIFSSSSFKFWPTLVNSFFLNLFTISSVPLTFYCLPSGTYIWPFFFFFFFPSFIWAFWRSADWEASITQYISIGNGGEAGSIAYLCCDSGRQAGLQVRSTHDVNTIKFTLIKSWFYGHRRVVQTCNSYLSKKGTSYSILSPVRCNHASALNFQESHSQAQHILIYIFVLVRLLYITDIATLLSVSVDILKTIFEDLKNGPILIRCGTEDVQSIGKICGNLFSCQWRTLMWYRQEEPASDSIILGIVSHCSCCCWGDSLEG